MSEFVTIRESTPADEPALEALYPQAFPEEDLRPLVASLLAMAPPVCSLVAVRHRALVGHMALTPCAVEGSEFMVALLGPLAVTPEHQRSGVGRALVEAGIDRMRAADMAKMLVFGDPAYYGRFGFQAGGPVAPPYPLPPDWLAGWQTLALDADAFVTGTLSPPAPWLSRALWAEPEA